jgi:hypothetical protein
LGRREKVLRRKSINQLSTGTTTMRRSARAPVGLIESIRIFGKGFWKFREEVEGESV